MTFLEYCLAFYSATVVQCRLTWQFPAGAPVAEAANADGIRRRTMMTADSDRGTHWRLVHDVVVFQVKLGLEAVLDITLIPVSLAAAALDLLLGNWRQPRCFHAVLRFGERRERRIDLWGAAAAGAGNPDSEVDAIVRSIETLLRDPATGPKKVRELRRWAAMKLAPGGDETPPPPNRSNDAAR